MDSSSAAGFEFTGGFQCPRTTYIYIYFLGGAHTARGMRDLSSPTRDRTQAPCSGSVES